MIKFCQLFLFLCLLSLSVSAQTRAGTLDNFGFPGGVQVKQEPKPLPPAPKELPKKLIKKTSQKTMNMTDAVSLKTFSEPRPLGKIMMSAGISLGTFTTGDAKIDSYIVDSSIRYNIDPLLIYSQMHQESSFKIKATSNKGASGLMQLMPGTARRFGVTQIYNPQQNIEAGVKYMRWLIDLFNGDVNLALAGYNAGEGAVMKYGWQIPPYRETQEYVRRISTRYATIRNPNYIPNIKKVTATEVAKLDKKSSAPLTVYERTPLTIRLPDGRMRLVNQ